MLPTNCRNLRYYNCLVGRTKLECLYVGDHEARKLKETSSGVSSQRRQNLSECMGLNEDISNESQRLNTG